jgi:hypothetical protein
VTYFLNKTMEQLAKAPPEERLRFAATLVEAAKDPSTLMANRIVLLQTAYQLVDQVCQEVLASMTFMGVAPTEAGLKIASNVIRLVPKKKGS